jgi:hypothetical protein
VGEKTGWEKDIKKPLIRQAGSAEEAFTGSATTGREQFKVTHWG